MRAKFQVRSDIPRHLQVGFFQPGVTYAALVRFSNARGEVLGDLSKDQRGIAVRVKTNPAESLSPKDDSNIQDFLMTNTPISFARNPVQFIEVGEILLGGIGGVVPRLIKKYGFKEARRILGVFLAPIISFKPLERKVKSALIFASSFSWMRKRLRSRMPISSERRRILLPSRLPH